MFLGFSWKLVLGLDASHSRNPAVSFSLEMSVFRDPGDSVFLSRPTKTCFQ